MLLAGSLKQPLTSRDRAFIRQELEGLLEWQRALQHFIPTPAVPEGLARAMPIVSLSVGGQLRGCFAYAQGPAERRLTRAFLAALADGRFPAIGEAERARLVAQVAYPVRARRLEAGAKVTQFAAGVHGLALVKADDVVLLVPDVAREQGLDEEGFVCALEHKAGLERSRWDALEVFAFETERVVARCHEPARAREDPLTGALGWLARQVESDGRVRFGIDSHGGQPVFSGFLRHARAASLVQALALDERHADVTARARAWLCSEVERARAGDAVVDWPRELPQVAGTLALCCLAGVEVQSALLPLAGAAELLAEPWHAAQVATALGGRAPSELWQVCVQALEQQSFAPWTVIAAHRRGDGATFERALRALQEHMPRASEFGFVAEPALAGLAVEALALASDPDSRALHARSVALLQRCQLWADADPAPDSSWVHGAFPLARNQVFLRVDASAHVALALATPRAGTT
ncbi:MAG TPA: AMMECR1 domain-containing protein [Polyangiaceae bacterium]